MSSLYRHLLKKSWEILVKFRYLWVLGVLAAFLGNGGEYQTLFNQTSRVSLQPDIILNWRDNLNAILPNLNLSFGNVGMAALNLIIGLGLLALFLSLCIAAFGGLIKGTAMAANNERIGLKVLLKLGFNKFWPNLGLIVLAKVIVYGILALVLIPLMLATFASGNSWLNALIIILTFLIFIPLTIIVSLATKYAGAYVMLENQPFWASFKNGWRLFAANWLISLEMALLLFLINTAAGLVLVALSALFLALPFFFGLVNTINAPGLFDILMNIGVGLIIAASLFIGAGLAVFQTSAWTMLYLRLTNGVRAYSKIVRWAAALPAKLNRNKTSV